MGLYLAHLGLQWGVNFFGFGGVPTAQPRVWDIAGLPLFRIVLGLYGLVTMPLTNAYSR